MRPVVLCCTTTSHLVAQNPEANKIVVRRAMEELVGQGKLELADQLYHESWMSDSVPGVQGPEAARLLAIGSRSGTPDLQITVEDQIAEGDLVVSRWSATGTHLGEWAGIPATGVVWTMSAIDIQRLEDGKIAQSWDYEDTLGLLVQLGVVPMPRATFTWGEPSDITGDPGTPEANKALVRRAFGDIWDPVNYDLAGEVYAEDYLSHVVGSADIVGSEMVKGVIQFYLSVFPDFQYHIEDQIAEGDKVMTRWTVTGTHMAELNGIPATGKWTIIEGVDIHRISDGRIQEGWSVMDEYSFLQQLGVIPAPETPAPGEDFSHVFFLSLESGLNMVSLPLKPVESHTARSFAEALSATVVIQIDAKQQKFVGFTPDADDDGFAIEGGQGYIVNTTEGHVVAFTGAAWTNQPPVEMAPVAGLPDSAWAFVVNAELDDSTLRVEVVNASTGSVLHGITNGSERVSGVWADLNRQPVIHAGDNLEVTVADTSGILGRLYYSVRSEDIRRAFVTLSIRRSDLRPETNALHPNYPNPFNPETWIPYELAEAADVRVRIFDASGHPVRDLALGHQPAGYYLNRSRAAYWDGRNQVGESVSSGLYTVTLEAGEFTVTRRMLVVK